MLGLALQGGGAKGAFQAGAIKALFEEGYRFDGVVGSSIGALNGALIAQGDFEKTYELWYNMEISKLFDIDDRIAENISNLNIDAETIKYVYRKIRQVISNRGLDRQRGRELIMEYLDETKLRSSKTDFGLVIIEKGEKYLPHKLFKEDIPEGLLIDYIIASGNLPIFKDLTVDGKKIYDGGFYDNLPINMLIDRGYTEIIAIRLGDSIAPVKKVVDNSVNIKYIDPSEKPGSLLNFTNKSLRRAIVMGYLDTQKILKGYIGGKYFIYPVSDGDFYKFLYNLPLSFYNECAIILGISAFDNIYSAVASVAGKVKELMKLETLSDKECLIRYIEAFAEYLKVERLKVYKLKEFLDTVIKAYAKNQDTDYKKDRRLVKLKSVLDTLVKYYK